MFVVKEKSSRQQVCEISTAKDISHWWNVIDPVALKGFCSWWHMQCECVSQCDAPVQEWLGASQYFQKGN